MTENRDMKKMVQESIDSIKEKIIEIGKYIFSNPEIGYQEHKACERLTSELKKGGFEVTKGVAGLETAFKATFRGNSEKPVIGILAEYDALPRLGHGCGHNLMAASAAGAALGLAKHMPELSGTLAVFGTPAEEGIADNAGGKVVMIEEFRTLDAAMIMHPLDMTTVTCESFNREALEIEFIGKASNAGNAEDASKGINALEAAMLTMQGINAFRLLLKSDARVFGIITEGGVSPNIIPDRAVIKLQIRVEDREYFQEVIEKVKDAARGAGTATGAKVNIRRYANAYLNMLNNLTLAEAFRRNLNALGMPVEKLARRGVATDMGNVSQVAPSIHPFIAIAPKGTSWHSTESAKYADSKEGYEATIKAAKAFAMTAVDIFTDKNLAARIREEFAGAGRYEGCKIL